MIKLIKSTFYEELLTKDYLCDFIKGAEILSMGSECREFEKNFAKWQECKYAVLFNSGSSANLALLQSIKNLGWVKDKDPVGFSALTWATNIMPLLQLGFEPVPLDVSLYNLNVSSSELQHKKINALFLTNALGFCADIDNIASWCEDNNVVLLEDNCEAMGSSYKGKKLGNYSTGSTFSFYVGHQMSTIEGGMVCTNNKYLYEMLLMVRCHGWTRNLSEDLQKEYRERNNIDLFFDKYTFYYESFNVRPTEITGFLGNVQLRYALDNIKKRDSNFRRFLSACRHNPEIIPLAIDMDLVSNLAFPVICINKASFNKYRNRAKESNVEIRPIIGGDVTKQPFYKHYHTNFNNTIANQIYTNGIYFPNHPEMTEEEVKTIEGIFK